MATAERSVGPASSPAGTLLTLLAAATSLAAVAGSLYLSIGMGLKACPLCLYERTFAMGAAAVLCLGLLLPGVRRGAVAVLALPAAVAGLALAILHVRLEATGFLECPAGILGLGSAPQQSATAFALLALLLVAALIADARRAAAYLAVGAAGVALGLAFAFAGVRSAPPSPLPKAPYDTPIDQDGCRRPYQG